MTTNDGSQIESTESSTLSQAKIERYKFILAELGRLNENTHKHTKYLLTLFPALASGALAISLGSGGAQIAAYSIPLLAFGILLVLTLTSLFAIISVFADIASWADYRREEASLIASMGGNFRSGPKLGNFWRWYETYLISFVLAYLVLCWSLYYAWFG